MNDDAEVKAIDKYTQVDESAETTEIQSFKCIVFRIS